jgi:5-methylcytosine-specific restriction protein B
MFLSRETEIEVINAFKRARWADSTHKMEYFFLFLMMKRMGISVTSPVTNEDFLASSEKRPVLLETLLMTTALFDPTKIPGKRCSLDPFAFDSSGTGGKYKYFNAGTEWDSLPTRIPDTIDNTLRDYYLERQVAEEKTRNFTLRQDYMNILTGPSFLDGRKINVFLLAAWLYRFHKFEDSRISEAAFLFYLRDLFCTDFNINEEERKRLFTEIPIRVSLSNNYVTAEDIKRSLPGIGPEWGSRKSTGDTIKPNFDFKHYKLMKGILTMNEVEIFSVLKKWSQAILVGPPGTGKSYLANKVANLKANGQNVFRESGVKIIQLHPSYSYEEFIGGIKWDPKSEKPIYEEGILLNLCKEADRKPSENFLLIIDEINRGNLSNIFGEAIMALDREYKVTLKVNLEVKNGLFFIPKNLYILGTMNSNDRSLALMDYALRRRFAFIRLDFDRKAMEDYYGESGRSPMVAHAGKEFNVIEFAEKLNENIKRVLDIEMTLGQSFFLAPEGKWSVDEFRRQFNHVLLPTLEEYTFGKSDKLNEILLGLNQRFADDNSFLDAILVYMKRQ